jgi:hypothetical protein
MKIKTAYLVMALSVVMTGCNSTNSTEYIDDTVAIQQEFSIEGAKAKQATTTSNGESMVQLCMRMPEDDELGYLWRCESTIVSAQHNNFTINESDVIENATLHNLANGKIKDAEGSVSRSLFKVHADYNLQQLSFEIRYPRFKQAKLSGQEYVLYTSVGVCEGKTNFSQNENGSYLGKDCYITYKKHSL